MDKATMLKQAQVLRNKRIGREMSMNKAIIKNGVVSFNSPVPRPDIIMPMMAAPPKPANPAATPKNKPVPATQNPKQSQSPQKKAGCSKCRRGK